MPTGNENTIWSRLLRRFDLWSVVVRLPRPALSDRGFGLIYDTERDITWLQNANYAKTVGRSPDGQLTWPDAMAWVASLNYRGIRGWRLPTALNSDGSGPCVGDDCDDGEIGHLILDVNRNHPRLVTFTNSTVPCIYWTSTEASAERPTRSISSTCGKARSGKIHSRSAFLRFPYQDQCFPGRSTTAMSPRNCAGAGCEQ